MRASEHSAAEMPCETLAPSKTMVETPAGTTFASGLVSNFTVSHFAGQRAQPARTSLQHCQHECRRREVVLRLPASALPEPGRGSARKADGRDVVCVRDSCVENGKLAVVERESGVDEKLTVSLAEPRVHAG